MFKNGWFDFHSDDSVQSSMWVAWRRHGSPMYTPGSRQHSHPLYLMAIGAENIGLDGAEEWDGHD